MRKNKDRRIVDEGCYRSRGQRAQPGGTVPARIPMERGIVLSTLPQADGCTYKSGEWRTRQEKGEKGAGRGDGGWVSGVAVAKVEGGGEVRSERRELKHAPGIPGIGRCEIWMTKQREHGRDSWVALLMCAEEW